MPQTDQMCKDESRGALPGKPQKDASRLDAMPAVRCYSVSRGADSLRMLPEDDGGTRPGAARPNGMASWHVNECAQASVSIVSRPDLCQIDRESKTCKHKSVDSVRRKNQRKNRQCRDTMQSDRRATLEGKNLDLLRLIKLTDRLYDVPFLEAGVSR